jgi:hypothetical protein
LKYDALSSVANNEQNMFSLDEHRYVELQPEAETRSKPTTATTSAYNPSLAKSVNRRAAPDTVDGPIDVPDQSSSV